MLLKVFSVLVFTSGVLTFQQHDYDLTFERLEVKEYDGKIVTFAKTHNFKYNRTNAVVNMTVDISENMGRALQIEVQAYRFASNEYRLFPLRFMFSYCDAVAKNDFGLGAFYNCGNFTRYPMKKGHFFICNWAPVGRKFPPYIPNGSYKLDLKYILDKQTPIFLEAYGSVTRPIV